MVEDILIPASKGFFIGAGLIIAIGAQNAFILKCGLLKIHRFKLALFCALSDALLISIGIAGIAGNIGQWHLANAVLYLLGALYLYYFCYQALRDVFNKETLDASKGKFENMAIKSLLVKICLLTYLNPHVYIDTVVLMGTIASNLAMSAHFPFAMGAILASFSWFFALAYGASFLSPFFKKPFSWQLLNSMIAIVMFLIASELLKSFYDIIMAG